MQLSEGVISLNLYWSRHSHSIVMINSVQMKKVLPYDLFFNDSRCLLVVHTISVTLI